jgi:alkyl hydroperoxide reductase subunit AhpC
MMQLREFARHQGDFHQLDTRIVAISVDDVGHNRTVWEKVAQKQFPVIRRYGLLHPAGKSDTDIALRTTLFIDAQGTEQWRRISETVPDIPKADEILTRIRVGT